MEKQHNFAAIEHIANTICDSAVTCVSENGYKYAELITASVIVIPRFIALGDVPADLDTVVAQVRKLVMADAFVSAVARWVENYAAMDADVADQSAAQQLSTLAQRCAAKDFDA
jgi:hypothetical protein